MFYTDTHAHLHMAELNQDTENILKRAKDADIKRIITVGTTVKDSEDALNLANRYKGIYAAAGVHPHDSEDFNIKALGQLEKLIQNKKIIAIGEVGLDYYRNISPKEKQREVFSVMVDIALSSNLPIIIHSRECGDDVIKILEDMTKRKDHKILFHCFSGEESVIEWGLKRKNVYFSFAGNVTYPKAHNLHNALDKLPLNRIFIETDCPYLTPVPFRGKPNEPHYIINTARFVYERKNTNETSFQQQLEDNFTKFFGSLETAD